MLSIKQKSGFLIALWVMTGAFVLLRCTPYPQLEDLLQAPASLVLSDCRGVELAVLPLGQGLRRLTLAPVDYPPLLETITRGSEDNLFYWHPGVDPAALLRAFYQYLTTGRIVSGGFTISMQLAGMCAPPGAGLGSKL